MGQGHKWEWKILPVLVKKYEYLAESWWGYGQYKFASDNVQGSSCRKIEARKFEATWL
jgi:hypothetical protein